jgi:hypothetical protein
MMNGGGMMWGMGLLGLIGIIVLLLAIAVKDLSDRRFKSIGRGSLIAAPLSMVFYCRPGSRFSSRSR